MEDASERRKRLKLMRDEASESIASVHGQSSSGVCLVDAYNAFAYNAKHTYRCQSGTAAGSTSLANPLIEQPEQDQYSAKAFTFYSDPLASAQARLSAPKQPQRHRPSMEHSRTTPVNNMLHHRSLTAASQGPYTQTEPPGLAQHSMPQPWGPPQPHPPQFPQPSVHMQPGHAPMHNFPGGPFPGRGGHQYPSWQASSIGPPAPQGAPFARPLGPQPPAGAPPGIRPAGRGTSHGGHFGAPRHGPGHGPARGRGRGRGRTSGGAGSNDNIEAYVSPAMLQDPWAGLMKQHQPPAAVEQPQPPVNDAGTLTTPATARQSMSDMFDAVEQEAQELSQGQLAEEGMQDRPWH